MHEESLICAGRVKYSKRLRAFRSAITRAANYRLEVRPIQPVITRRASKCMCVAPGFLHLPFHPDVVPSVSFILLF